MLTYIVLDTPNLAYINFFVLGTFRGRPGEKEHPVQCTKFDTSCTVYMKYQTSSEDAWWNILFREDKGGP